MSEHLDYSMFDDSKGLDFSMFKKSEEPKIIEEMHKDVTIKDRLLVKNFGNDNEASAEYLRRKHPSMDIEVRDDRILTKGKKDRDWRVLDPDTGMFSKDTLMDIGDSLYDIGSGVAEGAAAAGAGFATGGLGAVAGAGVTGVAMEGLRQQLGKSLGINKELDGTDIAMSGAINAALPGVGLATKGIWKGAVKKMAPAVGSVLTGSNKELLERLPRFLRKMDENGQTQNIVGARQKKIGGLLNGALKKDGQKLENEIIANAGDVDLAPVKEYMSETMAKLERDIAEFNNDFDKAKLEEMKKLYGEVFHETNSIVTGMETTSAGLQREVWGEAREEIKDVVSPKLAFKLKKQLSKMADHERASAIMPATEGIKDVAKAGRMQHSANMERILRDKISDSAGPEYKELNNKLHELYKDRKFLQKKFGNEQQARSTMRNYDNETNRQTREAVDRLSEHSKALGLPGDIKDEVLYFKAIQDFKNPSWFPTSDGGTTSTSKSGLLGGAGGAIGTLIGYNAGGGYAGATVGGMIGATLGTTLGGRKMTKIIAKSTPAMEDIADRSRKYIYGTAKSAWEMNRDR